MKYPIVNGEQVFMEEEAKVEMYVARGCLVVPIQKELHDESVLQVQEDMLKKVYETRVKGVVIDVSGVPILDSFIARRIFDSAKMAALLGAKTIIAGLRPGVAASLVDLGFDPGDILTAVSLEEGFRILGPTVSVKQKIEEVEDRDAESTMEEEESEMEEDENETDDK